jgi:hypothetical protein
MNSYLSTHISNYRGSRVAGQRILFIGIDYFSYDQIISEGLQGIGADVTLIVESPKILRSYSSISVLIRRLSFINKLLQTLHEEKLKRKIYLMEFDYVLVLRGESLNVDFIDYLRRSHHNANFILYQWDSINSLRKFVELRKRFDRCLTFDRLDALMDKTLIFRPLFFSRSSVNNTSPTQGLVFVGSLHSNRLKLIQSVKNQALARNVPVKVYIRVSLAGLFRSWIRGVFKDVFLTSMTYEKYLEWTETAEVILDFPHPQQSGLTMRTIEAIGLKKKLITTNKDIVNYDFYDPRYICVLDETDPVIPEGFLNGDQPSYDSGILEQYTLRRWAMDVLNS